MPSSKDEDRALAKAARTVMVKTILDVGEVQVSSKDGYIELTGKVRRPRSHHGEVNFKKEMEALKQHMRAVRGVKEVYDKGVIFVE